MFEMRATNGNISHVAVAEDFKNQKFDAGLAIEKIDGKNLNKIDILDLNFRKKGHKITFSNGKEKTTVSLNSKEFKLLLWGAPAFSAGILPGDKIISMSENEIQYFDNLQYNCHKARKKYTDVTVKRGDSLIQLRTRVSSSSTIGVGLEDQKMMDSDAKYHEDFSFGSSIGTGISMGYWTLHDYAAQMKFIFTEKGASSLGGFGAIGNLFAPTWDWQIFWERTALISIILAFMNILPIPALDGGHVVFLLYEMITGREAPEKVLEVAQYIGIVLILGLVLYANGNDIYRFFFS